MAQLSKKDSIAKAALPLFLDNGVKGTSVDMVVRASGVSKPTIYNHFPDKALLLAYVVACWIDSQPGPKFRARTLNGINREFSAHWLTDDALRLYGLFMGEGFRATEAKTVFQSRYDLPWRTELALWAKAHTENLDRLNQTVDSRIFQALF